MAVPKERLAAVERRIWRLSHLLTGDPRAASALVDRVLRASADAASLEPSRLDRLIIQQAREMPGGHGRVGSAPAIADPEAARALEAAMSLPRQAHEAWVLARIDELDELHIARAMDCSKTALRHHLAAADEQMRAKLGDRAALAIAALKAHADQLDPTPILAQHREEQRRLRARRTLIIGGAVAIAALAGLLALLRSGILG